MPGALEGNAPINFKAFEGNNCTLQPGEIEIPGEEQAAAEEKEVEVDMDVVN
jgi:hypothetical protein